MVQKQRKGDYDLLAKNISLNNWKWLRRRVFQLLLRLESDSDDSSAVQSSFTDGASCFQSFCWTHRSVRLCHRMRRSEIRNSMRGWFGDKGSPRFVNRSGSEAAETGRYLREFYKVLRCMLCTEERRSLDFLGCRVVQSSGWYYNAISIANSGLWSITDSGWVIGGRRRSWRNMLGFVVICKYDCRFEMEENAADRSILNSFV